MVWMILCLLAVIGIPFALGFWLGKMHERKRKNNVRLIGNCGQENVLSDNYTGVPSL